MESKSEFVIHKHFIKQCLIRKELNRSDDQKNLPKHKCISDKYQNYYS